MLGAGKGAEVFDCLQVEPAGDPLQGEAHELVGGIALVKPVQKPHEKPHVVFALVHLVAEFQGAFVHPVLQGVGMLLQLHAGDVQVLAHFLDALDYLVHLVALVQAVQAAGDRQRRRNAPCRTR